MALGLIAGIASGASSLFGAFSAGKRRREARRKEQDAQRRISYLENNRQNIINPYEDVRDLSSMVTNPFDNLTVATRAAEFQASETDTALATTLDTLRRTGQSAGGATALAQMAARSKENIAANIEQQEAQNARLRAQGEARMQQLQMSEKARVQAAQAAGKQFMFGAQETREMQQLNRAAGMQEQAMAQYANATTMMDRSIGGLFGAASGIAYGAFSGAFNKELE